MMGHHQTGFVAMAALIAFCGCFVSISVFCRARLIDGPARLGWLFLTAICSGTTIWSTHFVAMLGYRQDLQTQFDYVCTSLSAAIAVCGSGLGFLLALRRDTPLRAGLGGVVIGLAIAATHYVGMVGYLVPVMVRWQMVNIAWSVLAATASGAGAMAILNPHPAERWRARSAMTLFGLAILMLHFFGMSALGVCGEDMPVTRDQIPHGGIATAISVVSLIIIGTGFATFIIDTDARLRSDRSLIEMAFHDPLTGLPNRRALKDAMSQAFASGNWFTLLLIDLDHFKGVNDTFGHAVGDGLLRAVAVRLQRIVGAGGSAFRLGGDELAVTAFVDRDAAMRLATAIVQSLQQPILVGQHRLIAGCSVGLCSFENGGDGDSLLERADAALYEAKRLGRNQVIRYVPGILEAAAEQLLIQTEIQLAIDRNRFHLEFQPIVSLVSGDVLGHEALIRWRHATLGDIPPAKFIPIAEQNASIIAIGLWVLQEACRVAAGWSHGGFVAVNVSAVQARSGSFPDQVADALRSSGLEAGRLILELTETAIVANETEVAAVLNAVRSFGVQVALDDFGTGYSSLSYLCRLPLDRIKIDRSFVAAAEQDPTSMVVLRGIIQMGREMGIATVGEGVETQQHLHLLRMLGCDAAQGYFLGRPTRFAEEGTAALLDIATASDCRGATA